MFNFFLLTEMSKCNGQGAEGEIAGPMNLVTLGEFADKILGQERIWECPNRDQSAVLINLNEDILSVRISSIERDEENNLIIKGWICLNGSTLSDKSLIERFNGDQESLHLLITLAHSPNPDDSYELTGYRIR